MQNDNLIKMANQIGSFFKGYPDQEYAAKEIASHMKRFWAPSMRETIKSISSTGSETMLDDIVRTAITKHL
jgi:formate dehydrogenase subunit delta